MQFPLAFQGMLLLLLTQGQMRQAWQARGHQLLLYERHFLGLGLQVWPASERAGSNVPTFPLFCSHRPSPSYNWPGHSKVQNFLRTEGVFQRERQKLDDRSLESMHPFWHRDFWQISDIMSFLRFSHTSQDTQIQMCLTAFMMMKISLASPYNQYV